MFALNQDLQQAVASEANQLLNSPTSSCWPRPVVWVIILNLALFLKQNREIRTGEQQNGTGAQRPCPSPCMPSRISLCSSMPVYEGHLQGTPLHVRLVLQRGRTHKRTDPFPSTTILFYLWKRPDPRTPETVPPGLRSSSRSRFGDPWTIRQHGLRTLWAIVSTGELQQLFTRGCPPRKGIGNPISYPYGIIGAKTSTREKSEHCMRSG